MSELRGELRAAGAKMKVVKNRLARIAIAGKPSEKLAALFKGPTAVAFSEDPVAAARIVHGFAKRNEKLVILGGSIGAETFDQKGVHALAVLPSREELLGAITQALLAPAGNLVSAMSAPGTQLAGILESLENRQAA
jgi:large subunit ribosomal protein L10